MAKGKSANGGGTIRQRKDGRWEGRATIGFNPATGKQVQKSIYGKTQAEVRKKLVQMICELDNGEYREPTNTTLKQWLNTWLETYVKTSTKPYTYDSYERICNNHISPYIGELKLKELKSIDIQRFYNFLLKEKGISPKTIKNISGVLHSALSAAQKADMIKKNIEEDCVHPKVYKKPIKPLEEDDAKRFLEEIKGYKFEKIYLVTLFSGLRQGEVLGLTWDCVDFKTNSLFINKQLALTEKVGGDYYLAPTKNSRARKIIVAQAVMDTLKSQKAYQEELAEKAGSAWNNEWNLVFTNEIGEHLVHLTVYKGLKTAMKKIGLPEARFHDLRHTYAVFSLEAGDDIKTIQTNLGHATSSFTLDVYGHVTMQMREKSAERMEEFIKNNTLI